MTITINGLKGNADKTMGVESYLSTATLICGNNLQSITVYVHILTSHSMVQLRVVLSDMQVVQQCLLLLVHLLSK